MIRAGFVYDHVLSQHTLGEWHPMKPVRLSLTYDLLGSYNAFNDTDSFLVKPRLATDDEIMYFHTREYLDAVRRNSCQDGSIDQTEFNFGTGDNPVYEGMYEAASYSTGASMRAAEILVSGEVDAAMNISGGLHHAMPEKASGFCIFNDPVLVIKFFQNKGMRVAYVDIDCHHGDGVQDAFYDTDEVLTVSLHESGEFLFPGTGFTQETGIGKGRGYNVNIPLYPYTTDEVYLWAFREVVPPLLESFSPDVLVTQLGIDSHYRDPITHLALTVQGFSEIVAEFACFSPKWIALGGGGYDLYAVARAWTKAYAIMSNQDFSDVIPDAYRDAHGISTLSDIEDVPITNRARRDAKLFAERSVKSAYRQTSSGYGPRWK